MYGLITSQIDTAPKQLLMVKVLVVCLITSQIDTAPKPRYSAPCHGLCLITSQIDTAPKPDAVAREDGRVFDYQSDRHCAKTGDLR